MGLLSELRYPTTLRAKVATAVLALVFFFLLATVSIAGYLLYRVTAPSHPATTLDAAELLGRPQVIPFATRRGDPREGWFFPGLKGAPTVLLAHGYQSDRAEILTLVTALQEHQFNVFIFDFAGHGKSNGRTTLGYEETEELLAALEEVARRDDVDRTRFGIWGANLGAYAAIGAAASDTRVRAVTADSAYDQPSQLLSVLVTRTGLTALPLVETFCQIGFKLITLSYRSEPPLSQRVGKLAGVAKLFIQTREYPVLAQATLQLFLTAPEPREQLLLPKSNYGEMMDEEKRNYENQVVNFFLQNLPPIQVPTGRK